MKKINIYVMMTLTILAGVVGTLYGIDIEGKAEGVLINKSLELNQTPTEYLNSAVPESLLVGETKDITDKYEKAVNWCSKHDNCMKKVIKLVKILHG